MLMLILALSGLWPGDAFRHGTALAALRDNAEIAVAADSRVIDGLGLRQPDACKIRVFKETVVGIHGIIEEDADRFDLFALAGEVLESTDDLSTVAHRLATIGTTPLKQAIERILEEDPRLIRTTGLQSNPAGVILARSERGTPKLAYVRFGMRTTPGGDIEIQSEVRLCPGECPTGAGAILVSPDPNAESGFFLWHPTYWNDPLVPQAAGFVTSQASGLFEGVGPPVDVVRVAKGRITWIARKNGCREKE